MWEEGDLGGCDLDAGEEGGVGGQGSFGWGKVLELLRSNIGSSSVRGSHSFVSSHRFVYIVDRLTCSLYCNINCPTPRDQQRQTRFGRRNSTVE